ncbi:MAG: hypothetical protein L0Y54_15485 [Sporichthyaceae bacterium]|nr:hypothetical protein [Sporichthyaceae bacterium]
MLVKPDARVHDHVALDEIELYGELMIAASRSDGPLSMVEIDAILGVSPRGAEPAVRVVHRRRDRTPAGASNI